MKENMIIAIGLMAVGFLIVVTLILGMGADHKGPEITFVYDITYSEGQDISVLLEGVEAFDDRDGDVTANVMVDSLIVLSENQFARVTYTAKDNNNNVTKASRIVGYEGSGRSIYSASASQVMGESGEFSEEPQQTEPMTTVGDIYFDETVEETTVEENISEETSAGENDLETTADAQTTAAVREAPMLTLSKHEVTIHVGDHFNIASCVSSISDNKDSRETLYRKIGIDGSYDINTAGTYIFKVYCIDSDRNASNKESFTLHVVE